MHHTYNKPSLQYLYSKTPRTSRGVFLFNVQLSTVSQPTVTSSHPCRLPTHTIAVSWVDPPPFTVSYWTPASTNNVKHRDILPKETSYVRARNPRFFVDNDWPIVFSLVPDTPLSVSSGHTFHSNVNRSHEQPPPKTLPSLYKSINGKSGCNSNIRNS